MPGEPRGAFLRLNDGPDSPDHPIDLLVTVGYNGDEVYGTVFFTGWPVYVVSYEKNRNSKSGPDADLEHSMIETQSIDKSSWEQVFAHFLVWIDEANEDFVDSVLEDGLFPAMSDGEGMGDGHALTAFVGEVMQKMHELQPDLVPEPTGF